MEKDILEKINGMNSTIADADNRILARKTVKNANEKYVFRVLTVLMHYNTHGELLYNTK